MKKILFFVFLMTANYLTGFSQKTDAPDSLNTKPDNQRPGAADSNKVFTSIQVQPEIDKDTWNTFLKKHINYDIAAFNDAPRGAYIIKVKFTVFTDGHVGDVKAITRFGYGMEEEVVRALKKSPKWTPASQNGKLVNCIRVQTVTFKVEVL